MLRHIRHAVLATAILAGITVAPALAVTTPAVPCALACQEGSVYHKVMHSRHPKTTWRHLSGHDRTLFYKATKVTKVRVVKNKVKRVAPPRSLTRNSHKNWRCAKAQDFVDWTNMFGGTTEGTWVNAFWCWTVRYPGDIVMNKLGSRGGETTTPGWSYTGIIGYNNNGTGYLNADQAVETQFVYGFGADVVNVDRCTQSVGGSGGGHAVQRTCKLSSE